MELKLNASNLRHLLPQELLQRPIWCGWVLEDRGNGHYGKPPINPHTMRFALQNEPLTWASYEDAYAIIGKRIRYNKDNSKLVNNGEVVGVGIQTGAKAYGQGGIIVIDIDHCVLDGKLSQFAQDVIARIDSYAELSVSEAGVHIIAKGYLPKDNDKIEVPENGYSDQRIELYAAGHFIALTGNAIGDHHYSQEDKTETALEIYNQIRAAVKQPLPPVQSPIPTGQEFNAYRTDDWYLQKALYGLTNDGQQICKPAPGLLRYWEGERDKGSESENDYAFMCKLAYHSNKNKALMIEYFRASPYAAQKDDQHRKKMLTGDYLNKTADKAIGSINSTARSDDQYSDCPPNASIPMKDGRIHNMETASTNNRKTEAEQNDLPPVQSPEEHNNSNKFDRVTVSDYLSSGAFEADIAYFKRYKDRKTGFKNLDKYLTLYPGLACLTGSTSLGKTSFCVQLADQLAEKGEHVLYFALEQLPVELVSKTLARAYYENGGSNFDNIGIKSGATDGTLDLVKRWQAESLQHVNIYGCDFTVTADDIVECVKAYIADRNVSPVVFVDYLQLISAPTGSKMDNRERIDDAVKKLKLLSKECGLFVMMISNMARSSYRERVSEEAFKESGLIEYTCDYLFGLQLTILEDDEFFRKDGQRGGEKQTQNYEKERKIFEASQRIPKEIVFKCMKNRNGKKAFRAFFQYRPNYDHFCVDEYNENKYEQEHETFTFDKSLKLE